MENTPFITKRQKNKQKTPDLPAKGIKREDVGVEAPTANENSAPGGRPGNSMHRREPKTEEGGENVR